MGHHELAQTGLITLPDPTEAYTIGATAETARELTERWAENRLAELLD